MGHKTCLRRLSKSPSKPYIITMRCRDCGSEFNVGWRGADTEGGHLSAHFMEATWVMGFLALLFSSMLPVWSFWLIGLLFIAAITLEMRIHIPCPKCGDYVSAWFWAD